MKSKKLPFVVALPIPTRDRHGRRLARGRRKQAIDTVLAEVDRLFGGAKAIQSPATYRTLAGKTIVEEREPLVLSMTTRKECMRYKDAVKRIAAIVGKELDQESMAIIAFDAGEGELLYMD